MARAIRPSSPLHRRPALKRRLARLHFAARAAPARLVLVAVLFAALAALLLCSAPAPDPSDVPAALERDARAVTSFDDPCLTAVPLPLKHFDPALRISAEFAHADQSDTDPPLLDRVFTAFFKNFLFEPNSDIVVNLTATGRGLPTDLRDAVPIVQRALRIHARDPAIVVTNFSMGYSHLDRVRGIRHVYHVASSGANDVLRTDVVAVQRTFDSRCRVAVAPVERSVLDDWLYVLVPYSSRLARLRWFLSQFDRLRNRGLKLKLVLAINKRDVADVRKASESVRALTHAADVVLHLVGGDETGFFSRAVALRQGARAVPENSMMFISDIDMHIYPPLVSTCIKNVVRGSQVYFPVFYSLFAGSTHIDKNAGYWRTSSYGMSCMYRSDFDAVNAYEGAEVLFSGWGGEDLVLMQAFRQHKDYQVFRAVEPALRHKWHVKQCEPQTAGYDDCMETGYLQLGTASSISRHLAKSGIETQTYFAMYARDDDTSAKDENLEDEQAEQPEEAEPPHRGLSQQGLVNNRMRAWRLSKGRRSIVHAGRSNTDKRARIR